MPTGAYVQVDAASSGNGELTIDKSAANSGNKRRRTDDTNINHLTHLPTDQLVNIADYLSKTSRALFAVALTAPSSSFRKLGWRVEHNALHAASRAIISSSMTEPTRQDMVGIDAKYNRRDVENYYAAGWEQLNLLSDAANISDDDIGALLICIDAKNTLKNCD